MKETIYSIFNDDCLIRLPEVESSSVDCVIADLPYYRVVEDDFDNQWQSLDDYLSFVRKCIAECHRILKPEGSIFLFTSRQLNRHICTILDEYFNEQRIIIWARKRAFNNTRGKALASGYEPIAYYSRGSSPTFNNIKVKTETTRKEYTEGILKDGITMSDVWTDISALPHNSKEKVGHPTQKPVKLMRRIVEQFTNEGDVVLDFCMGSGSTGVACIETGRDFIGIESDAGYFDIARCRLEDAIKNNIKE